jgi:acyltransferase
MTASKSAPRWLSLDVFRGLAIVSMIQGHVFTALLRPDAYEGDWVSWHSLLHGLTAPMFLIGGGIAYGFVTLREGATTAGRVSPRIVKRGLQLLALGYLLQLPRAAPSELLARPDLVEGTLRVGPLQLVGVCLLLAELVRVLALGGVRLGLAMAGTAATIAGVAPFVWKWHASQHLSVALGAWLDGYRTSMFPLFPWGSFFFLGVLVALLALRARRADAGWPRAALPPLLFALGGLVSSGCFLLHRHGIALRALYGEHELWHTSPLYVLFRAGLVVAWLGLLCALEPLTRRTFAALPGVGFVFDRLAKQSLVAYVVHLLMLYGSPVTVGLVRLGPTLDVARGLVVFALVMAATTVLALVWDRVVTSGALVRSVRQLLLRRPHQVDGIGESHRLDAAPVD